MWPDALDYLSPPMGDVDIALRHLATQHPEDLALRFVPAREPIASMRWLDTQVASRERRLDKCLVVQLRAHRVAIHAEWFIDDDAEMGWRMFEYAYDILAALRAEDAARHEAEKERAEGDPSAPPPRAPDPVFVRSFAVEAARARARSREELDDLASAMHVVATARPKGHNFTQRILQMFKEEGLIERTWLFQHGVEKGIEKGIEKASRRASSRGRARCSCRCSRRGG